MKSPLHCLGALALVALTAGVAPAQAPDYAPGSPAPMPGQVVNATVPVTSTPKPAADTGLSSWILGVDPDCCGPLSERNPLRTELFVRSGAVFPFGNGQMADSLETGWAIAGGFRALCFNDAGTAALTFEMGLENRYNGHKDGEPAVELLNVNVLNRIAGQVIPTTIPVVPDARVDYFNRTSVNFGIGQEFYLFGTAAGTRQGGSSFWRIGYDVGGRWGSAKAQFIDFRHFTDEIGVAYASIHSDLEFNCGCCTFFAGLRGEYEYTWSDILQLQNKSDIQDIAVLANVGIRF
jgi:hypothetical protein